MSVVFDAFESFVGVNVWTMIFAWCNLLVIYLFLKKILFKPMKKMIDSRQKEVDDMYENAANAEKQANEMKDSYEEKLNKANEESARLITTSKFEWRERKNRILVVIVRVVYHTYTSSNSLDDITLARSICTVNGSRL